MNLDEWKAVRSILRGIPAPVVVNLGAYHGEDHADFVLLAEPGARLTHIMVEPDPANCAFIRANVALSETVKLIEAAIYKVPGRIKFWRSQRLGSDETGSGSVLKPTGHLKHIPDIVFPEQIEVGCATLDDLWHSQHISGIDLLWVDIQGAEAAMIEGGKRALAHTRFLLMEAEEVEFYEGQLPRHELLKLLPSWELIQTFGPNVLLRNTNAI
jgi:FkbM family methyltransferase